MLGKSLAERVPIPGVALYAMNKSALVGLTKGPARELDEWGITVNLVHPGKPPPQLSPKLIEHVFCISV
ncbi:SDR family NAD(P)-dependent oxidoreductase [Saccharomonospora sp. NPDC046836]|uniref:SDR family NAD(P)-dependent oxidoreductase n=1 Tax=Saccharomonospora sp. NPDC046836 TaxID=3156921 RepID=UPI0033F77145